MSTNIKKQTLSSLLYKYLERIGHQGIVFTIQIILARLLSPDDYGYIALLVIFINISQIFVQSGLGKALVQNKDAGDVDFSSVFYISLGMSVILYWILFFSAPFIAGFYEKPELSSILRVLALILIPGAFNSIQNAKVSKDMMFKKLLYSTLGAAIISGAAGIAMAYLGYGVWALVSQQLINQVAICVIMWFAVKWRPRAVFDIKRVKVLFSFGWRLLCSNLLNAAYENLRGIVVGMRYSAEALGFYDRGKQFPNIIINNINSSTQVVMFPVLSKLQDDTARMKSIMRRSIVTISLIIFPLMVGLAITAEPLIQLILTDKWLPAVPFLQIYCFTFAFFPIHTANLQAIKAQGRIDWALKLEIIKVVTGISVLFITVFLFDSPIAIAFGGAALSVISSFINAYPNKKLLNYSYIEQIRDILPQAAISLIMGACIYPVTLLKLLPIITITTQVLAGAAIYITLAWVFKIESFIYIKDMVWKYLSKKLKRESKV